MTNSIRISITSNQSTFFHGDSTNTAAHPSTSGMASIENVQPVTASTAAIENTPTAKPVTKIKPHAQISMPSTNTVHTVTENDHSNVAKIISATFAALGHELRKNPMKKKICENLKELASMTIQKATGAAAILDLHKNSPKKEAEDALERLFPSDS